MRKQFRGLNRQAAERLFVAVVNQAIIDVLENGEETREAKRWLLSKDFDRLERTVRLSRQTPKRSSGWHGGECSF